MSEQDNNLRDQVNSENTFASSGAAHYRENAHWHGQPSAEDAQTPPGSPQIITYLYRPPNSEDAQASPDTPQLNTYLYRSSNLETPRAQLSMPQMDDHRHGGADAGTAPGSPFMLPVNGHRSGEADAGTAPGSPFMLPVNGHRHEDEDAATFQQWTSTSSTPQVNGITENPAEPDSSQGNPHWQRQADTENPQAPDNPQGNPRSQRQADPPRPHRIVPLEVLTPESEPEPARPRHRLVIEFQPPRIQTPVVFPELRASCGRSFHSGYSGGAISSLDGQSEPSEQPRTTEEPRMSQTKPSELPQSSENTTSYLSVSPSPRTANSTNPPETPLPPTPTAQSTDKATWHEYDTAITPEAIAEQEALLSTWNHEASTARIRAAEEEAHIRAVELESELLSEEQRRERRHRRRQRQAQTDNINRNSPSLMSGLLARLRERIRNRIEARERGQTQSQSNSLGRHHQDRSDISLHRLSHLMHTLSSASSAPSQPHSSTHTPPPPEQPPPTPTPDTSSDTPPPPQARKDLCILCLANPGTLIQGPLSQSLTDTIPFICCQECLNELLEAEVQIADATDATAGERQG